MSILPKEWMMSKEEDYRRRRFYLRWRDVIDGKRLAGCFARVFDRGQAGRRVPVIQLAFGAAPPASPFDCGRLEPVSSWRDATRALEQSVWLAEQPGGVAFVSAGHGVAIGLAVWLRKAGAVFEGGGVGG